jgi:hypothetical protein
MRYDQQPDYPGMQPDAISETPTSTSAPFEASAQSRRNFLRTAVISGVAVATIGSSAGVVVEACAPHPGILRRFGINLGTASGTGVCSMCIEDNDYRHITNFTVSSKGHASPSEYFIWLTAHDLAPGSYTMNITPEPSNSSSPFRLLHGSAQDNNASLFALDANKAFDCPTCDSKGYVSMNCPTCGPKSPVRQSHSASGLFATAYSVSGSNRDLQMRVDLKWDGTKLSSDKAYTFTGTVKDGSNVVICTATVSVTAKV